MTGPIDKAALRVYRETLPSDLRPGLKATVVPAAILFVASIFLISFWSLVIGVNDLGTSANDHLMRGLIGFIYLAMPILAVVLIVRGLWVRRGTRQFRLDRFARDNRLLYTPSSVPLLFPGMIFTAGHSALGRDIMRQSTGSTVIGNYQYTVGSGKNQSRHRWGFASIQLGTSLPHIVLDATGNNSLFGGSNLPEGFRRDQRLELEGDFSKHFTLYCPRGYESDALYLFTPDIMARFIDHAAELDVEIIDDRLYLYSKRDLSTLDPATWEWLVTTLDALGEKVDRWQRWRDSRLGDVAVVEGDSGMPRIVRPPRGVAATGRRLTKRTAWVSAVLMVAFLLLGLYSMLEDVVSWLLR
ncbi:hypothetical protein ESP50_02115 [Agromyces atrinae]|uniref:DUF3137 domain-containing protein n=1 Tax=Agromyces atrinae TaxID=592376 RepID=A0A4Q2M8L2_9MICO|nr:hypothetical protein ESP50_02115 [Agromyces atrinae]